MDMRIFLPILLTAIIIIGFGVAAFFLSPKEKKKPMEEKIEVLDGEGTICQMLSGTVKEIKDNPPTGILVTITLDEKTRENFPDEEVLVSLYPYQYEDKDLKENDKVSLSYVVRGDLEGNPKLIKDCTFTKKMEETSLETREE